MRATDGIRKISKITRLIGGGVAAMAAAAGMFAASATPAFAATYWETGGVAGVLADGTYTVHGDDSCDVIIYVADTRADGHRAGLQFEIEGDSSPGQFLENTRGNGTTVRYNRYAPNTLHIVKVREYIAEGPMGNGGHFVGSPGPWVDIC